MTTAATNQELFSASPATDFQSFRSRILGTWDLVYYIGTNISNPEDVLHIMGEQAVGQIMYTNDGYMAALLQEDNLKPFDRGWKNGNVEELASAARKTMAYGGAYYVDEETGKPQKIVHHAEISMCPNLTNTLQIRCAELLQEDGQDYIILGPEAPIEWEGVQRLVRLKWQKRSQNIATHPPPDAREQKL